MKSSRKKFFGHLLWVFGGLAFSQSSCKTADTSNGQVYGPAGYAFGSGDIGMLNYFYVLEQVSAAFYHQVSTQIFAAATADEIALYGDIYLQELCHREFLKTALGSNALPQLELDFSSVNFTQRASVLATAMLLEDLGIRSGNVAAANIQSSAFMTIAAEILSVESRHATYIHESSQQNSFSGSSITDVTSLEQLLKPQDALTVLSPFIRTRLDAGSLKTS